MNNAKGMRKDRLIRQQVHDPYKTGRKPPEPSVCPFCNAVFRGGRWQWAESWPADAHREPCQACQRIRDRCPAGLMTLGGAFVSRHKEEILNLVRKRDREERAFHPLHRIMSIEENGTALAIQTTDIHLPRLIGEALRRAFKGELNLQYEREGCLVRVNWKRED